MCAYGLSHSVIQQISCTTQLAAVFFSSEHVSEFTSAVSAVFYADVRFTTDAYITFMCSLNYILIQPELRYCPSTSFAFVCQHIYSTCSNVSLTSP